MSQSESNSPTSTHFRARSSRWWVIALAVVVTAAVMALGVIAGKWQYGRHEFRSEAIRAHDVAQGLPVIDVAQVMEAGATFVGDAEWRRVSATGVFDSGSMTALRFRSVSGTASLQYLAWFVTDAGAVLVNTGWIPRDDAAAPTLPAGTLTIEGIVRQQEEDDGRRDGGATRITLAQMPTPQSTPLPGWLMLREPCTEDGCLGTALQPVPEPALGLGPHLSYAYQWWLLAVVAPIAAVLVLRRDAKHERASLDQTDLVVGQSPSSDPQSTTRSRPVTVSPVVTAPKAARRRRLRDTTDEDYEDAL